MAISSRNLAFCWERVVVLPFLLAWQAPARCSLYHPRFDYFNVSIYISLKFCSMRAVVNTCGAETVVRTTKVWWIFWLTGSVHSIQSFVLSLCRSPEEVDVPDVSEQDYLPEERYGTHALRRVYFLFDKIKHSLLTPSWFDIPSRFFVIYFLALGIEFVLCFCGIEKSRWTFFLAFILLPSFAF